MKKNNNKLLAEGLRFTPFSLEIVRKRDQLLTKNFVNKKNNILISFGYFDQMNLSLKAINELLSKTNYNIIVIVSSEAEIYKQLYLKYRLHNRVKIFNYIKDISSIYLDSVTSLGTFGLMSLERAYLAVPQVNILEELNQKNIMIALTNHNFAISFDNIFELFTSSTNTFLFPDKSLYQYLASKSKNLFGDGVLEWVRLIDIISS